MVPLLLRLGNSDLIHIKVLLLYRGTSECRLDYWVCETAAHTNTYKHIANLVRDAA